jgi:hypothetical protein
VKSIAQRIWNEPSVGIGLLTSVLLAVVAVASSATWNTQTILGVVAPFASSLGIRQLVTPTAKKGEDG